MRLGGGSSPRSRAFVRVRTQLSCAAQATLYFMRSVCTASGVSVMQRSAGIGGPYRPYLVSAEAVALSRSNQPGSIVCPPLRRARFSHESRAEATASDIFGWLLDLLRGTPQRISLLVVHEYVTTRERINLCPNSSKPHD